MKYLYLHILAIALCSAAFINNVFFNNDKVSIVLLVLCFAAYIQADRLYKRNEKENKE